MQLTAEQLARRKNAVAVILKEVGIDPSQGVADARDGLVKPLGDLIEDALAGAASTPGKLLDVTIAAVRAAGGQDFDPAEAGRLREQDFAKAQDMLQDAGQGVMHDVRDPAEAGTAPVTMIDGETIWPPLDPQRTGKPLHAIGQIDADGRLGIVYGWAPSRHGLRAETPEVIDMMAWARNMLKREPHDTVRVILDPERGVLVTEYFKMAIDEWVAIKPEPLDEYVAQPPRGALEPATPAP